MSAEYRMTLATVTVDNAEGAAKAVLDKALARVGFIPNMYGNMVNSPGVLDTYLDGYKAFREQSGLTPPEQEVVFLTISRENGCSYCVAAHSMLAQKVSRLDDAVISAIRDGTPIADARLSALATFTRTMLAKRGLVNNSDVQAFLSVGYTERQILEVVLALAVKTLSNYSNHLFHTELDARFVEFAWKPAPMSSAA